MRKYELMVLLSPMLSLEELEKVTKKFESFFESVSASGFSSSILGKKPLSYKIKKLLEAYYVLFNFEMEPLGASALDTKIRQDENVIRHLLVRKD